MARFGSSAYRVLLAVLLLAHGLWGCGKQEARVVSLGHRTPLRPQSSATTAKPLRLGMGAMITPKDGYLYYHKLKLYLEEKLGRPVQLVDRDNYDQLLKLLRQGELDASFICAGPYVEGHEKFGLEILAMPLVDGVPQYYAYIIVPKDSLVRDFTDLRGKTFGFIDPKSNTGRIVPAYELARRGESPEHFFKKVVYTYGHDHSIMAVAEKMVDGAAVGSHVWEFLARTKPELVSKTRIIARFGPYGFPPFTVTRAMDAETKLRLRKILLTMHEDPRGRQILVDMLVDRFIAGDDKNYASVREMKAFIEQRQRSRTP